MNIIVKPHGSDLCYCRPDTTWERENRDFYSPECVNEIQWAPVVFARVCKAGKCIGKKFASRYYDGIGCGILLYCNKNTAFGSCADHTSILPMPMYSADVLEGDKAFDISINGQGHTYILSQAQELLEDTLCRASQLTSLRIGDFVASEITPLASLTERTDGETVIKGNFCGNDIFDFRIIF